jgi:hypothetical protein
VDCYKLHVLDPLLDENRNSLIRLSILQTRIAKAAAILAGPSPKDVVVSKIRYYCICGAEFASFLWLNNHIAEFDDPAKHRVRETTEGRIAQMTEAAQRRATPSGSKKSKTPISFDPANMA